ncbi:MAG: DUF4395 family protein [Myxococcales bacterium]|nr:DUF4395 family protein [Myxococcales bacterium]
MTPQAHPYRDLAVIDSRAPRTNQTVVAIVASIAVATGAWWLLAVLAAQLAIAVRFGRRYCLPCRLYFDVIQPRFGEGPLEDARAPRFANIIGATVLAAAAASSALGWTTLGAGLGLTVVVLATAAATTGLCVGCELYKIIARARGIRGGAIERVDLAGLGEVPADRDVVVVFTHPLCGDCQRVGADLAASGKPVVAVDVSRRRDLAKKYGVTLVPLAVAVDAHGYVTARLA